MSIPSAVSVGMFSASRMYLAPRVANRLLRHRQHVLIATQTVGLPRNEGVRTDFRNLPTTSAGILDGLPSCRIWPRPRTLGRFSVRAHPPIRGQARVAGRYWPRSASGKSSGSTPMARLLSLSLSFFSPNESPQNYLFNQLYN